MQTLFPPLVAFIIVLSIVVLIHELGHFLAAKFCGVKVVEFGWGLPPRIFGWYKNEKGKWVHVLGSKDVDEKATDTIYSLNSLPIGGFVRLFGESEDVATKSKSKELFFNQNKRSRSLIILAGVFMNLVLGVFCFSTIYSVMGIPQEVNYIKIEQVVPESPAAQAGLLANDKILKVDGKEPGKVAEFISYVKGVEVGSVDLTVQRGDQNLDIIVSPRKEVEEGKGSLGVLISNYDNVFYPTWQMPFRGAWVGVQETYAWTKMMVVGIGQMLSVLFSGKAPEVSGPVGIYQITATVAQEGLMPLLKLIGILSINLAVVNLLPFPALDGGRFMFICLEVVRGKKLNPEFEAKINMAGMVLLLALMSVITFADIWKLVK